MKKLFTFLICASFLISCSEDITETTSNNPQSASDIDFPNSNTRTEIIQTTDDLENEGLISRLISDLKSEKFELEERDIHPHTSFYDSDSEVQFVMRGNGMKAYAFKRTEAKPENYYPDFILTVFEFETESAAASCFDKIEAPAKRGMQLPGVLVQKNPQTIVLRGNEVFFLSTRAEMFRGYIEDCAKRIEGY